MKTMEDYEAEEEAELLTQTTCPMGMLPGVSRKDDAGKPRFDLLPPDALEELAKLYTAGAVKYGPNNWAEHGGLNFSRVYSAMQRHANKFWAGQDYDDDPVGAYQHHMASVAWCALTLLAYTKRGIGRDDRPEVSRGRN